MVRFAIHPKHDRERHLTMALHPCVGADIEMSLGPEPEHDTLYMHEQEKYEHETGRRMIGLFEADDDGRQRLYEICNNGHMLPTKNHEKLLAAGTQKCPYCSFQIHKFRIYPDGYIYRGRSMTVYRREELDESYRLPPCIPNLFKHMTKLFQQYMLFPDTFADINNPGRLHFRGDVLSDLQSFAFEWDLTLKTGTFDWNERHFIASTRCDELLRKFLDVVQGMDCVGKVDEQRRFIRDQLIDFMRSEKMAAYHAELARDVSDIAHVHRNTSLEDRKLICHTTPGTC